jgi:hypothetical protein|tara:strand:- start:196 stop:483 length:288 start_codon:yes stop_codon:yes gene_type:complete
MNAEIKISSNYGFDHNWTLVVSTPKKTKSFYLGQDVKFCSRVLEMDTAYVVQQIGTREIDNGTPGNKKLAKFICKELNLNGRNIDKIEGWGLCAE